MNLILLALDENQFSGELPPELGGLGTLKNVWLEGNEFEGCAPDLLHDASSALDMRNALFPTTQRKGRHWWLSTTPALMEDIENTPLHGYPISLWGTGRCLH